MHFSDTRATTIELVRFPSVTDSQGETDFGPFLASRIRQMEYFRKHPGDLVVERTQNDTKERSIVMAFVRGSGSDCIILTGHYDVVPTTCYGTLEPLAFDPEALSTALVENLAAAESGTAAAIAREDLASGRFLAGRGVLDMKSGLAAGLTVLERFASTPDRRGNLLFLAVPDEENSSAGIRYAMTRISDFLDERLCILSAVINLDCTVDQSDGQAGRAIFLGSVGKLLPFVHFVGLPCHVSAPFDGVNPSILAAQFVLDAESGHERLGEEVDTGDEGSRIKLPPPPSVLYMRELRDHYNVTTANSVFCALNVLSHHRNPKQVLDAISTLALESMQSAIQRLRDRARGYSERSGHRFEVTCGEPRIVRYGALLSLIPPGHTSQTPDHPATTGLDPVARCAHIVDEQVRLADLKGPMAIVGFAPPYYPKASYDKERDEEFLGILHAEATIMERETGQSLRIESFFPGISDMSYLDPGDGPEQIRFVNKHSPLQQLASDHALGCPVINIGPWGREYHQTGERVEVDYTFRVLPELLWRIVASSFNMRKIPDQD